MAIDCLIASRKMWLEMTLRPVYVQVMLASAFGNVTSWESYSFSFFSF